MKSEYIPERWHIFLGYQLVNLLMFAMIKYCSVILSFLMNAASKSERNHSDFHLCFFGYDKLKELKSDPLCGGLLCHDLGGRWPVERHPTPFKRVSE